MSSPKRFFDYTSRPSLTGEGDDTGNQSPPKAQRMGANGPHQTLHTGLTASLNSKLKTSWNHASSDGDTCDFRPSEAMSGAKQQQAWPNGSSSRRLANPGHAASGAAQRDGFGGSTATTPQSSSNRTQSRESAELTPRRLEADLSPSQTPLWGRVMKLLARELSVEEKAMMGDQHRGAGLDDDRMRGIIDRVLSSVSSDLPIQNQLKEKWVGFVRLEFPFR